MIIKKIVIGAVCAATVFIAYRDIGFLPLPIRELDADIGITRPGRFLKDGYAVALRPAQYSTFDPEKDDYYCCSQHGGQIPKGTILRVKKIVDTDGGFLTCINGMSALIDLPSFFNPYSEDNSSDKAISAETRSDDSCNLLYTSRMKSVSDRFVISEVLTDQQIKDKQDAENAKAADRYKSLTLNNAQAEKEIIFACDHTPAVKRLLTPNSVFLSDKARAVRNQCFCDHSKGGPYTEAWCKNGKAN